LRNTLYIIFCLHLVSVGGRAADILIVPYQQGFSSGLFLRGHIHSLPKIVEAQGANAPWASYICRIYRFWVGSYDSYNKLTVMRGLANNKN